MNKRFDEYVRGIATGGTLFEELGFYYVGPVDAHDLDNLVPILENIRDNVPVTKPVLLHVKSVKGKGYPPAEAASDKYHGVAKFDVATGKQKVRIFPNSFLYFLLITLTPLLGDGPDDTAAHVRVRPIVDRTHGGRPHRGGCDRRHARGHRAR